MKITYKELAHIIYDLVTTEGRVDSDRQSTVEDLINDLEKRPNIEIDTES